MAKKSATQIHLNDERLRKMVERIRKIDPCSRTFTQAIFNACDEYLTKLEQQQNAKAEATK